MYYPMNQINVTKSFLKVTILLVIFFFLFIPSHSFADILMEQQAQEYRMKGYEEQQKGNLDKALTHYEKAVTLGVKNAVLFNDIGIVYEQLGIPAKAEEFYIKSIQLDSNYLSPYTNLAYLYEAQGDIAQAVKFFRERYERASRDDPWREKIRKELVRLDPDFRSQIVQRQLEAGRLELVEKNRTEFNLQVERGQRHFDRAEQYILEKKFNEAIVEFDRALAITPNNPKILDARAETLHLQKMEEIKTRARRAVESLDAGELESAKRQFQEILTLIPDDAVQKSE